jgi:outer membrane protein assembly factor BamC
MKVKIGSLFIAATILTNLSACSYIKSLFPDKEKDYQYTTEIPPLILPNDLKNNYVPSVTTSASSAPVSSSIDANLPEAAANLPAEEEASTVPPTTEPVVPDAAITVERIQVTDGENHLRINVPFLRAWRMVNKALSRKAIEVTERNQEAKLITVQYDSEGPKAKDDSYWGDIVFMFTGIENNDKTYLLKLEENNQQTDIVVVDKDQQLLSDAASVKLMTLLEETIKADLAKK